MGSVGSSRMTTSEWDPQNVYSDVISVVEGAAGGKSKAAVYRVEGSGTRATYFVVALDKSQNRLVGVKVLAIES